MASYVADLCRAIHPDSDRGRITMVLRGYFDESYNQERKAFTVAGWISDGTRWGKFSAEWMRALKRIPGNDAPEPDAPFHMAHLQNFQKTFDHWANKSWRTKRRLHLLQTLFAIAERRRALRQRPAGVV